MIPSRSIWENIQNLQAADTVTLASATAMKVHLAVAAFVPSLDLALGSLTEATFAGYAAIAAGTGTQPTYYDVVTGLRVIEILIPAGGWRWKATGTPSPAQTIYGVYLTDGGVTTLYGSFLLPSPVTISASGQGVEVASLKLAFATNSPS